MKTATNECIRSTVVCANKTMTFKNLGFTKYFKLTQFDFTLTPVVRRKIAAKIGGCGESGKLAKGESNGRNLNRMIYSEGTKPMKILEDLSHFSPPPSMAYPVTFT